MLFAMIFAILFIGFLFAYAVPQIQNLFCLTEKAQTLKAVKDLKDRAEGLYTKAEGSSDIFRLSIPSRSKVCFFHPEHWRGNDNHYTRDRYWEPEKDPYVLGQLDIDPADPVPTQYSGSNVWVFSCDGTRGYTINKLLPCESSQTNIDLSTTDGNFCAPPGSELYFINEGTYMTVQINEEAENNCIM